MVVRAAFADGDMSIEWLQSIPVCERLIVKDDQISFLAGGNQNWLLLRVLLAVAPGVDFELARESTIHLTVALPSAHGRSCGASCRFFGLSAGSALRRFPGASAAVVFFCGRGTAASPHSCVVGHVRTSISDVLYFFRTLRAVVCPSPVARRECACMFIAH